MMKKFLAVYTGSMAGFEKSGWNKMDPETRKRHENEGKQAWGKWVEANAASIVDNGSPLGKTKRISAEGIADTKNELTAYTVVQAESHEAAAKLFEGHPHFTVFPGDAIEVMECTPIPGA